MTRTLLMIGALMFSLSISAQTMKMNKGNRRFATAAMTTPAKGNAQQRRAPEMKFNTLNVGYVNEYDNMQSLYVNNGTYSVASYVSPDMLKKYVGCQVVGVRIAVASTAITNVRGWFSTDPESKNHPDLGFGSATTLAEGWNDIRFDTKYTITGDEEELWMGYDFTSKSSSEFTVLTCPAHNDMYSFVLDAHDNYSYGDYTSSYGALAIQLIVEGDLPKYDIALDNFSVDKRYYTTGDSLNFYVLLTSMGLEDLPSTNLLMTFDGDENKAYQLTLSDTITSATAPFYQKFALKDFNLAPGMHTISLEFLSFGEDGKKATEGTEEDDFVISSFGIYENPTTRQKHLLEVYCNQNSYYDVTQIGAVENLCAGRADIIPVCLHGDYYGPDYADEYALPEAYNLSWSFLLEETPSIAIDRVVIPGSDAMLQTINTQTVNPNYLGVMADYIDGVSPSFASVSISAAKSNDGSKLVLTVSASRGGDFKNIFKNGNINVILTEDGIVGSQKSLDEEGYSYVISDYVHNNVARKFVTPTYGAEMKWNGLRYNNNFIVDIDPTWKLENMHAIAFISKTIDEDTLLDNVDITNANNCDLKDLPIVDAINNPSTLNPQLSTINSQPTYTLDGRRISGKPTQRGIYIQAGKKIINL